MSAVSADAAASRAPDLDRAPVAIAWETTRACALRCVHCRADAIPRRDPAELTTNEGFALIDEAAALGARVLVLTGGDPFMRPDIFELIARGRAAGLHVGLSPSATARADRASLARAVAAGAGTIHLSLDGAVAETHDAFRGVRGSWQRTIDAIRASVELGARVQVATTACRRNVAELEALPALLAELGVTVWSLFFLVPVGRGRFDDMLDASETERILEWLASLAAASPFQVRTICAPQFRRVLVERGVPLGSVYPAVSSDGRGFCFVSHRGDVWPSGFLPLSAGNVREIPLAAIYREAPLFVALRDPARLGGRCGACPYARLCGGSRARAFAVTGDPFAEDPACPYLPAAA